MIRSRSVAALLSACAFAAVLAGAGRASADDGDYQPPPDFGENPTRQYASPQRFNLEIKFGPYSPNIDASQGIKPGDHPFADLFPPSKGGSRPPGRLLTELEFDYEFLHRGFGTLAIGHTLGYYRRTTHSLEYTTVGGNAMTSCVEPNCTISPGDTTALNIIPLTIEGIYRFDYLANRYHIPFVPYFKAGIGYYIWWIENGGGFFSIAQYANPTTGKTDSGFGGTWGWVLHPGGSFLLDVIDPNAARVMDAELGINHTYLFCEFSYANITGFGAAGKMNLSDTTLNAGLSFEF